MKSRCLGVGIFVFLSMDCVKTKILQRVIKYFPLEVHKDFLSREPDFNESFINNSIENIAFLLNNHQPIKEYRFSFFLVKKWANENNIEVFSSNEKPDTYLFLKR